VTIHSINGAITNDAQKIPAAINIQSVIEHIEKLIISPSFDSYSEHILRQTIMMLESFELMLFQQNDHEEIL